MQRRKFIKLGAQIGISLVAAPYVLGATSSSAPVIKRKEDLFIEDTSILSKSPASGKFELRVEGKIPSDLRGSLFRNGPTLFERNGLKRNSIIDGDGYISKLNIGETVTFEGQYVQTQKFKEEEAKGEFIYDTWTTALDGSDTVSLMEQKGEANQSSISVKHLNGKLYSFDESNRPYEIDKDTLETLQKDEMFAFTHFHNAHGKVDVETGEFINFGLEYGSALTIHLYSILNGEKKYYHPINISKIDRDFSNIFGRGVYMHDFFVSKNYIVFNLQPLVFDFKQFGSLAKFFLNSEESLAHSFSWRPELKNRILIIDRHNVTAEPIMLKTKQAMFSWHTFNAQEVDDKLLLDFIGYDDFNFFNKRENVFAQLIDGKTTQSAYDTTPYGSVVRYTVQLENYDAQSKRYTNASLLDESIINATNSYEFCTINPKYMCQTNHYGYATANTRDKKGFFNAVSKIDFTTFNDETYYFDESHLAGEFVFCAKKDAKKEDDGYLIGTVADTKNNQTFLAIFDAQNIKQGTVAKIYLDQTMTMRLHGEWVEA